MKLSEPQERLLCAIQRGVTLCYHRTDNCVTRSDTGRGCTTTAWSLLTKGLIRRERKGLPGFVFHLTEAGRCWPALPEKETTG